MGEKKGERREKHVDENKRGRRKRRKRRRCFRTSSTFDAIGRRRIFVLFSSPLFFAPKPERWKTSRNTPSSGSRSTNFDSPSKFRSILISSSCSKTNPKIRSLGLRGRSLDTTRRPRQWPTASDFSTSTRRPGRGGHFVRKAGLEPQTGSSRVSTRLREHQPRRQATRQLPSPELRRFRQEFRSQDHPEFILPTTRHTPRCTRPSRSCLNSPIPSTTTSTTTTAVTNSFHLHQRSLN